MTACPVMSGARLLGMDPKTLHHWLKAAEVPWWPHPTDARLTGVAEEHLLELAKQQGRPWPDLPSAPALDGEAAAAFAAERATPRSVNGTGPAALAERREQLAQLHTQVMTLQQQPRLEALLSAPLEPLQPSQPLNRAAPLASCPAAAPRLRPVELRARSRVRALIAYGAGGQSVAVCPQRGVLSLVPRGGGGTARAGGRALTN